MTAQVAQPPAIDHAKLFPWDNPVSKVDVRMAEGVTAENVWARDLVEKGWAIVKGVITKQEAAAYADRANDWLEGFKFGYDRNDRSTWQKQNLPRNGKGGLYSAYSFAHAQFVWDIKSEPGVVGVFEKIWGTDELTVSFDGGNLSVPLPPDQLGDEGAKWPHADQSPLKPGLVAIQGLLNLLPNGPDDGGLAVMTNSVNKMGEMWKAFEHEKPTDGWSAHDHIRLTPAHEAWLESHGCKWEKPCLEPGDFIVWDSRCCHYGASPTAGNPRFAVYVCYKPDAWIEDEMREKKEELFEKGWCTSHDPCTFIPKTNQLDSWNIIFPYGRPKLSDKALKAAGVLRY